MKRIEKSPEPENLKLFREANPHARWEPDLRPYEGGNLYREVVAACLSDQGGICAYCEIDITKSPLFKRIEHFHSKSDDTGPVNWSLVWDNLFGVCNGGSKKLDVSGHFLPPLPNNLSCDAHKEFLSKRNTELTSPEGLILNPLTVPDRPNLFKLEMSSGKLLPDIENCALVVITPNRFATTADLVTNTIMVLNLNCDRLCECRRRVIWDLENFKKTGRDRKTKPEVFMALTSRRKFGRRWPEFFTTWRCLLGEYGEIVISGTN